MLQAELNHLPYDRRATSAAEIPRVFIEQAVGNEYDAAASPILEAVNPWADAHGRQFSAPSPLLTRRQRMILHHLRPAIRDERTHDFRMRL